MTVFFVSIVFLFLKLKKMDVIWRFWVRKSSRLLFELIFSFTKIENRFCFIFAVSLGWFVRQLKMAVCDTQFVSLSHTIRGLRCHALKLIRRRGKRYQIEFQFLCVISPGKRIKNRKKNHVNLIPKYVRLHCMCAYN